MKTMVRVNIRISIVFLSQQILTVTDVGFNGIYDVGFNDKYDVGSTPRDV
jgi:hypothetical protein